MEREPLTEISFSGIIDGDFYGKPSKMETYTIDGKRYEIYEEEETVYVKNYRDKYATRVLKWGDREEFMEWLLQSLKLELI